MKCCQNGELCGRRRTHVRDKVSAPAAPYGRSLLYVATILARKTGGDSCCPAEWESCQINSSYVGKRFFFCPFAATVRRRFIMQRKNKGIFTTKMVTSCALLAALSVVLARFLSFAPDPTTRYSIEAVPIFLAGMLFGPIPGAFVGFTADFVGCMYSVQGAYNPIYCVPPVLYGLFAGLFRYYLCEKPNLLRVTLCWLPPVVLGSILYQSAAMAWTSGQGIFFEYFITKLILRTPQFAITLVADVAAVYFLCKTNVFKRIGLWPQRKETT